MLSVSAMIAELGNQKAVAVTFVNYSMFVIDAP